MSTHKKEKRKSKLSLSKKQHVDCKAQTIADMFKKQMNKPCKEKTTTFEALADDDCIIIEDDEEEKQEVPEEKVVSEDNSSPLYSVKDPQNIVSSKINLESDENDVPEGLLGDTRGILNNQCGSHINKANVVEDKVEITHIQHVKEDLTKVSSLKERCLRKRNKKNSNEEGLCSVVKRVKNDSCDSFNVTEDFKIEGRTHLSKISNHEDDSLQRQNEDVEKVSDNVNILGITHKDSSPTSSCTSTTSNLISASNEEKEKINYEGDGEEASDIPNRTPYYLENFETILTSVFSDESNRHLFNDDDKQIIDTYKALSEPSKKLYVRLFGRKLKWIPLSKLNYPEIADDLRPLLEDLNKAKFIDNDEKLTDLEELLHALSAGDIKSIAKSYHVSPTITQKGKLVQELVKKSQQTTIGSMFGAKGGGVADAMKKKVRLFINGIYRLQSEVRAVFLRTMMLYSLVHTSVDEENGFGGQGQLFHLLMVNIGKVVYPSYTVRKDHQIFSGRQDVIRLEESLQLESDLLNCTEKGIWDDAYLVYKKVIQVWREFESNKDIVKWNENLPDFLRSFTATSVIYRLLNIGIDILQRRKEFSEAIDLLGKLLSQTTYCCSYRGYWWDRMALNLDAHLKQPLKSLEVIAEGLSDTHVKVGHRLSLYQRAEVICQRSKLKIQHRLKEFHHDPVAELPKVHLEGRVLHQGLNTTGTLFLLDDSPVGADSEDMTVERVEGFVLDHYTRNGFSSGIHAEGSVISCLFSLYFWDILYSDVPDAFHSPFQTQPLDMYSPSFYTSRKEAIDDRLKALENSSVEELQKLAEDTWTQNEGCNGMNWEKWKSIDSVKGLVACMGGKVVSGITGRYARCPRHTRSGFPDLTLWNVDTGALKICEVKGPGDRLSHKQILWIDFLLKLGVDAEVCHVKAIPAKKLKPTR